MRFKREVSWVNLRFLNFTVRKTEQSSFVLLDQVSVHKVSPDVSLKNSKEEV